MKRNKRIMKISLYGVIVNIVLSIFKYLIGVFSGSIAITLDALNNSSDILSSIITIIGVKLASKKPDKKHPFGHGRLEYLVSSIIAILIFCAGFIALKTSFYKIIKPSKVSYNVYTIITILVSVITKFIFGKYVRKISKSLNSNNLFAIGTDALSDSVLSSSTLVSVIVFLIFNISIDGYLGCFISVFIIKTAIDILKGTIDDMIGVRSDGVLSNKLKCKIASYNEVRGVYDLIIHNYGPNSIIATAHIEIRDDISAKEIHKLTRKITVDVYQEFGIVLTLGIYASNDKEEYRKIRDYIDKIPKKYKSIIQTHGFYVDEDSNDISFDIIFNFSEKDKDMVIEEIKKDLKEKNPNYNYSVIVDIDYTD